MYSNHIRNKRYRQDDLGQMFEKEKQQALMAVEKEKQQAVMAVEKEKQAVVKAKPEKQNAIRNLISRFQISEETLQFYKSESISEAESLGQYSFLLTITYHVDIMMKPTKEL